MSIYRIGSTNSNLKPVFDAVIGVRPAEAI